MCEKERVLEQEERHVCWVWPCFLSIKFPVTLLLSFPVIGRGLGLGLGLGRLGETLTLVLFRVLTSQGLALRSVTRLWGWRLQVKGWVPSSPVRVAHKKAGQVPGGPGRGQKLPGEASGGHGVELDIRGDRYLYLRPQV